MQTCYRHPDRETGLSCQRCERHICSDCSTPGAVGFLCPEDAKEKANIRQPKFQQGILQRAPVTITLIAVNVLVYGLQMLDNNITGVLAYARASQTQLPDALFRAFASGFAHSPSLIFHIIFNMYSLFILGTLLEPLFGKIKFTILYFFSIFGGSLGVLLFGTMWIPVIGASGAVFGLMGAYFVASKALKMDVTQILVLIAINLGLGFLPGSNISWEAHVGGLAVGVVVAGCYVLFRRANQRTLLYMTLVGLAVILAGVWEFGNFII